MPEIQPPMVNCEQLKGERYMASDHLILASCVLLTVFPAFAGKRPPVTVSWRDGIVLSVGLTSERSAKSVCSGQTTSDGSTSANSSAVCTQQEQSFWDVTVQTDNTVYVVRPWRPTTFVESLNASGIRTIWINPVPAGSKVQLGFYSNGSVTIRSNGREFYCSVVAQRYVPPTEPERVSQNNGGRPLQQEPPPQTSQAQADDRVRPTLRRQPSSSVSALTNADVLKLSRAGLGDEVIVEKINNSPADYSVEPDDLIALKKAGLSNAVIGAMVRAQALSK